MKPARAIAAVVLFCFFTSIPLGADERILNYHSQVRIESSGVLLVTETIEVRAEGKNIRRGIYRDFPTRYKDRLGNHYRVDFQVISVKRNGAAETWHTENRSNGTRVYFGSAHRLLQTGKHLYELQFSTNRQLGFFDDFDELYWNVTGNGWMFPIDQATALIQVPGEVPPGQMALTAYTGPSGSTASDATSNIVDSRTVKFETTRGLGPREGFTVVAAFPKGIVIEPSVIQKFKWFLSDNASALVLILGWLAALAWYLYAWHRVGRDPERGVIIPRFEAPAGLSPAACSYVSSMAFNRTAFVAAIISLAIKKQLIINEDEEFSLRRVKRKDQLQPTAGEQALLNELLPLSSSTIELDNKNHSTFSNARNALRKALKKEHLGRLFHLNSIYIGPAFLISVVAAIIAIFFDGSRSIWIAYVMLTVPLHGLFVFLMRAPTPAGRIVMDEIEGLKMYLETAEQDRLDRMRSPALTPEVFEAFLPYAYALGVENDWCERFAREMPEEIRRQDAYQPAWYSGNFHGVNALHHIGDNFSSEFSSAISSASSPPGSSSGSGGGGSSGGGGGGGGGGGW